jgi:hypothetical protein
MLAGAAVALARPAAARAASEGDVLDRLIAGEDGAAFGYDAQGMALQARLAADHAKALRTHVDALGRRGPLPPTRVGQLSPAARRVAERGTTPAVIALEESLLKSYEKALAELDEASILRTAATIAASHSQQVALLRRDAGLDPFAGPGARG